MHDSSISTRACLATQRNVGGQMISLRILDVDVHLFRNFFFFLPLRCQFCLTCQISLVLRIPMSEGAVILQFPRILVRNPAHKHLHCKHRLCTSSRKTNQMYPGTIVQRNRKIGSTKLSNFVGKKKKKLLDPSYLLGLSSRKSTQTKQVNKHLPNR